MAYDLDQDTDTKTSVKGQVKEVLGAVTGDRAVEAEGRVEQQVADPSSPVDDESDDAVRHEELAARQAHGDLPLDGPVADSPLGT